MKKLFILIFITFFLSGCFKKENIDIANTPIPIKQNIIVPNKIETESKTWVNLTNNIKNNTWVINVNSGKTIFIDQKYIEDSSLQKFVNDKVSFNNLKYIPNDLVLLNWDYIVDKKLQQQARIEAVNSLIKMSQDFYDYFWEKIVVVSAYRSYDYQKWIKDRGCSDLFCAKAWYSEHQSGLALDFFEATSKEEFLSNSEYNNYYVWLKNNAHNYGFHNSYQNGREVDWYVVEPWHWRYLWVDFATYLHNNNQTFAEYYNNLKAE